MTDPLTIIHGDALSSLKTMESESVQCVVTSPPYWGLRDYGTGKWDGGDPSCDHKRRETRLAHERRSSTLGGGTDTIRIQDEAAAVFRDTCGKCGAQRIDIQIGLEKTPEEYVARLVEVFSEVKRVLRKAGTLWLNLGDSYASGKGTCFNPGGGDSSLEGHAKLKDAQAYRLDRGSKSDLEKIGLKPKDLVGIPWMVAFALRADGWYLRSDIIWSKPNPMPESVTDRPTKSHEYIFLLSKSERYYFDQEAIKEKVQDCSVERAKYSFDASRQRMNNSRIGSTDYMRGDQLVPLDGKRNIRSVWSVSTQPFSGAHFATFPPDLIKPCILAGAPVGGVVLDTFAGSGTTGKVAIELGRKAVLIEPKAEYVEMIKKRCQTTIGLPLAI